ncbi:protein translocase subunit SecD [Falsigemmobacter intermedius]|uniref:Multifunctional fusion protein n=1 Tax=Falsigemmobacter intermedius TaxID=1553448 RepID=A0A444MCY8_9RHOB|nr:protein translocase subunit SecD [Falsigemmobacter intermedius]RWY42207.1 protein translocase subunit SecD [Falsigemmobacter intermedius]
MHKTALWKRLIIWGLCLVGLLFAMPNAFYTRVETHNDAHLAVEKGESLTPEQVAALEDWPQWLPSGLVNLGLDLRGGAHLLAEVQVTDVYQARMDSFWPQVRDRLRDMRDQVGGVRRQPSAPHELRIEVQNQEGLQAAVASIRQLSTPVVSLTGVGQNDIEVRAEGRVLVISLSEAERAAMDERTIAQSLEIIRRRVDEVGTREPTIQRQGADRILIQVPGIGSAAELKSLIGTTAKLTFNPVQGSARGPDEVAPPGSKVLPSMNEQGVYYIIETAPVVTGEELVDAQPSYDQNGRPAVNFRFNPSGARTFGDYTAANIGRPFAIVLDEQVISAPVIQSHIPGGSGIISGNFTLEESTELAVLLRAGALPAGMTFLEERTIGPELGQDSIDAGKRAAIVGTIAVAIFMVVIYGSMGVIANIALIINGVLLISMLSLLGATLTLPGIAGIVLTLGMAVDSNVLIFERIREELRAGKAAGRSIELGFDKALSAIMDANITAIITAVIMFAIGSGPVRGFAVTFGLGIITTMFTAVYVTKLLMYIWYTHIKPKRVTAGGLIRLVPDDTKINFFRWQGVTFGGTIGVMVAAIIITITMGLNFGIDFKGGTTIRTESTQEVNISAYRDALHQLNLGDVNISQVFDPAFRADQHVAMIRIQAQDGAEAVTPEVITAVEAAIKTADPQVMIASVESVGPKVSSELIWLAIGAVAAGSVGILIYIWMRFEWQFAIGLVAACLHDVVITLGIFSLFQIRFDLTIVAALLTILGYSVNDTVVIFDRLRENMAKHKSMALRDLMNLSTNETLGRTVMTSASTLLALFALLWFGGDVIRGFVFAMILGVVLGTWSTLYVAKNIVLYLGVDRGDDSEGGEGKAKKPKKRLDHEFANIDA